MKVTVVGICGGTGSGKTTLARAIAENLGPDACVVLSQDRYYRDLSGMSPRERDGVNFDHPDSLDFAALVEDAKKLKAVSPVDAPVYDFASHSRRGTERLEPRTFLILEGLLILHPAELREMTDYSIFLTSPDDIRFIRRLERDTKIRGRSAESVVGQYLNSVRPMHERFIRPLERFADRVLDTSRAIDTGALLSDIRRIAESGK